MKKICLVLLLLLLIAIAVIVYGYYTFSRQQTTYGSGFEFGSCEEISEKDVYELCVRMHDKNPEEFEAILLTSKFHQRIEPNSVFGVKMALYAKELLGAEDDEIFVMSEAGEESPMSYLNDGIMTAIGSTFGKGLIMNLEHTDALAATFKYKDELLRLEVKPRRVKLSDEYTENALKDRGGTTEDYYEDMRKMGLYVWENLDQDELFDISYPEERNILCEYTDKNVDAYNYELNALVHTIVSKEKILAFIEEYPCVTDGAIDDSVYPVVIRSVWKSNDEVMEYVF